MQSGVDLHLLELYSIKTVQPKYFLIFCLQSWKWLVTNVVTSDVSDAPALKSFLLVNLNYLVPSFMTILSDYICLNFDVYSYNITYFPFCLDTVLLLKSSCLTIKAICTAFFYFVLHMPCFNAGNSNPRPRTIRDRATKQLFITIFHIITNKVV